MSRRLGDCWNTAWVTAPESGTNEASSRRDTAEAINELQSIGVAHALAPLLDVARDLRWDRVEDA